jgi:hypothetical protein
MPAVQYPQNPFNEYFVPEIALAEAWEQAEPYSDTSRLRNKRFWKPGNLVLREYQAAELHPETAIEHFEELQAFGMRIASRSFELVENADSLLAADPEAVVAFGATRYIRGCHNLDRPIARREAPATEIINTIVKPIRMYLQWCQDRQRSLMLDDIYLPGQYSWVAKSGEIFLHDIDPLVTPCTAEQLAETSEMINRQFAAYI